jgi:hypothetical protein
MTPDPPFSYGEKKKKNSGKSFRYSHEPVLTACTTNNFNYTPLLPRTSCLGNSL